METRSIASNLIYQRKIKGYSQEELSGKTNVTVRTIQRIEKGEVQPHLQTVKLLAGALEIEVEDLIVLENPKEETIKKKWLLLLHGTPILGLVIPFCNILLPLFLWIHKREDNPEYDKHGKAIVNFQITMTLALMIGFILLLTLEEYGFYFFVAVIPYTVIVSMINLISAVNSYKFYFPLSIPFLRNTPNWTSKDLRVIVPLLALCLGNCSPPGSSQISRLDGSVIAADSLMLKITSLTEVANVHGMAVTVFNNNEIRFQKTFGHRNHMERLPLTDSTNIYGASLSKAIFAVLVMKLVEEQHISLDTPLESYLPRKIYEYSPQTRWHDDFSALSTDSLYPGITARMCLSHTTGLPNWRWIEPDHQLRVKFEPGSRYQYSGEGLVYLQVIIEKILQKNLEELAQEKIFKPLGMNHSSYQWRSDFENNFAYGHSKEGKLHPKDIDNEARGASTLETTAADHSRFLESVFQQKLLSQASWEELFSPQIRIKSTMQFGPLAEKETTKYDPIELSYGLGWGLLYTPYGKGAFKEGHGDGFQHYSIIFPEVGKGIMIMTNSDNGESVFKRNFGGSYRRYLYPMGVGELHTLFCKLIPFA